MSHNDSGPSSPARQETTSLLQKIFLSLSVNYLPSKFSSGIFSPGARRCKHGVDLSIPKRGGGWETSYDGVSGNRFGGKEGGHTHPRMRWNKFKMELFVANVCLSVYALTSLIFCLLTWFDVFEHANIVHIGNCTDFILSTIAAAAQRTFNLEGKINGQWSWNLDTAGRLRIQNRLHCCGYYSPSILPECKMHTQIWYTIIFSLVPLHILIILAGLLCCNHVTYRFGKGVMPKAYHLSLNSMAIVMDHYASQFAEQYGSDVALDILARSRSDLGLGSLPYVPQTASVFSRSSGGSGRAHEGMEM
ncbi:hypothetical protein EDD17DRAFT_1776567 [Pisolithus thermaeus]|nr:hypothetical protein EV401DRAFT_2112315 [Pisolithus croceorrhizus]KAI6162581.1 hypothetical protein EDD17DRAFT_1776567 [Pisolithus thermaeus]